MVVFCLGDWNEDEDSDCGHSSGGDEEIEENEKPKDNEADFHKSFYFLMDAKETLNLTITPNALRVINELITQYSNKIISVRSNKKSINLVNDIGPQTKIELYEKHNDNSEESRLIGTKKFENEESAPNSPNRSNYFTADYSESSYDDKDR